MTPIHLLAIAGPIAAAIALWIVRRLLRRRISARLARLIPVLERARGRSSAEEVLAAYRTSFGDVVFVGLDDDQRRRVQLALTVHQPWFHQTIDELLQQIDREDMSRPIDELENEPWYETTQELIEAYVEVYWSSGTALETCLDWLESTQTLPGKEAIWSALAWEIPEPEILPRLWKAFQAESDLAVQRRLAPWISEIVFDALSLADSWARSPSREIAESLRKRLEELREGAAPDELEKLDESLAELVEAFEEATQHDGADRAAI